MAAILLPSALTVKQFAFLTQRCDEVIRRKVRARLIKGSGNPVRIPCRELLRFNVTLEDAAVLLHNWQEAA